MLLIFIRSILIYALVLIVMRIMGKREIGQLQPFEFAISIMIADLAATPMSKPGIPITYGVIPIFSLLVLHLLISIINMKSIKIRKFICGKPSILIYRGRINEQILKKENFTINELQERLRGNNIFDLADVEYAILETNGQISVITKPEKKVVSLEDLNIVSKYNGIPYDLVIDGKVQIDNLKVLSKTRKWLEEELAKYNIKPEEALIVTIDATGNIFYQKKESSK